MGDQILAISGFSMEKFLQKNPTARSRMSLMGPQRVVLRLKAEKGHVKEAVRTVQSKPITHQRADFRRALQEESQRFSFRHFIAEFGCFLFSSSISCRVLMGTIVKWHSFFFGHIFYSERIVLEPRLEQQR